MRIIISPAKQMRADTDSFACSSLPVFMEKTEILMHWIQRKNRCSMNLHPHAVLNRVLWRWYQNPFGL